MTIPKFRAWIKEEKRMLPVASINFDQSYTLLEESNGLCCERDFDEIEFMQSTGFEDVNGEELFEGDIIATDNYGYLDYGRVFYSSETASFRVAFVDEVLDLDEVECDYVAGNIYENSELLEEE